MNSIAEREICFVLDIRKVEMKDGLLCGMSSLNPIDCTSAITYILWSKLDDKNNRIFYYNETNKDNKLTNIEFNADAGTFGGLRKRLCRVSYSFF